MKFSVIICGESSGGKYNPYVTFHSDVRKGIIIGLHKGQSFTDLAKSLEVSEDEILNHLEFLRNGGFVREQNGKTLPNFFVALREDVLRTRKAAIKLGGKIGKVYERGWEDVVKTYNTLLVSPRFGIERVGFVLIGAYSLDMIDKFEEEGRIMPAAPKKKTGRYYMWGVENGMEALGRYGMHNGKLKEYGFATFGGERERKRVSPPDHRIAMLMRAMKEDNVMDAYLKFTKLPSSKRESLNKKIEEITIKALREYERKYYDERFQMDKEAEKHLMEWLYLDASLKPSAPIYTESDVGIIQDFVNVMSEHIFDILYKNMDEIKGTFKKCQASKYADFPEFFCWYYHLTFTEAIDYLIRKGVLTQPVHGYEFWLWKTKST
jgi:hypothetical protein